MKRKMRSAFKRLVAIIIIAPLLAACQEPEIAMPTPSAEAVQVEESSTGGLVEPAATATTPSIAPPATATPTAVASESEETATAEPEATGTATPAPTSEAVVEELLLSDDFTDSGSGWPALQRYDNYYIGYHEPEWYHVEVQVPNDFAPVVLEGQIFEDVTAEAEVFVETSLSENTGDFRYGLVLRRAGKQFYAFTVSPRTRTWAILKSSPTLLETLAEGSNETISGLDEADTLRVDAAGSTFAFHINGEVVGEVHDGDYPGGELGFFVQTFDSERVHIHYESLSVREVDAPPARCTVTVRELNLRPGPGASPPEGVLYQGTSLIPLTRSAFPPWIQVQVEDGGQTGWVYAVPQYVSCNFDLSILPLP